MEKKMKNRPEMITKNDYLLGKYVKPLIDAVVKRENVNPSVLSDYLRIAKKQIDSLEDEYVRSFINSLNATDILTSASLAKYLNRMINDNKSYCIFQVYSLTNDLPEDSSMNAIEIDEFLSAALKDCDSDESTSARIFSILLSICRFAGIKVNMRKVSIEDLIKLATPTISDIANKASNLNYKIEEISNLMDFIEFDEIRVQSTSAEPKKVNLSKPRVSNYKLWKNLYDELSDIVNSSVTIIGGTYVYDGIAMVKRVHDLLVKPEYKEMTQPIRQKIATETYTGDILDYVIDYVSQKLKEYEGD